MAEQGFLIWLIASLTCLVIPCYCMNEMRSTNDDLSDRPWISDAVGDDSDNKHDTHQRMWAIEEASHNEYKRDTRDMKVSINGLPPITANVALPAPIDIDLDSLCSRVDCMRHAACLTCNFDSHDCQLGGALTVNCTTHAACAHQHTVVRNDATCRYCWQTVAGKEHRCEPVRNCSSNDVRLHRTFCRAAPHIVCMGRRTFYKNVRCRWTNGYSWSRTMFFSVTLGGFGADRFYLGLWKSGIGKLFSFGGLGVWTLVDIVLIAIGYIQPADGSMYI